MKFYIYEQRPPVAVGKDKRGTPIYEMNVHYMATIDVADSDEAIEIGKVSGIAHPIVECANGYDENGNPRAD